MPVKARGDAPSRIPLVLGSSLLSTTHPLTSMFYLDERIGSSEVPRSRWDMDHDQDCKSSRVMTRPWLVIRSNNSQACDVMSGLFPCAWSLPR